jgi:hypothetical protein
MMSINQSTSVKNAIKKTRSVMSALSIAIKIAATSLRKKEPNKAISLVIAEKTRNTSFK